MEKNETRAAEMKRLRYKEFWTLQMIADRYGISRERVRQIIGNTGYGYTARLRVRLTKQAATVAA